MARDMFGSGHTDVCNTCHYGVYYLFIYRSVCVYVLKRLTILFIIGPARTPGSSAVVPWFWEGDDKDNQSGGFTLVLTAL